MELESNPAQIPKKESESENSASLTREPESENSASLTKEPENNFNHSNSLKKEFQKILCLFQNSLSSEDDSSDSKKEQMIQEMIQENSSSENVERINFEFCEYGPLNYLIDNPSITEIIINNKNHICFEMNGALKMLNDSFLSDITFNNIVEKLSTEAQLTVNYKKPFAEGRWRQFRIHILRPPLIQKDFHISLRNHPKVIWTFKKLEQKNWAPQFAIDILKNLIKEKLNFLLIGPTSSGKTSVLNACLQELSPTERVITIEDADELVLPNTVSTKLLTQSSPEHSLSLIGQEELLKQSLRLRPDRLVLGEVRGPEAKDLLLALASGHHGSIGTIHGNHHKQILWKLEILTQMGAPQWQSSTIQKLIFSSLQCLVVLDKVDNLRILKGIYKITSYESTGFLFESLYEKR